MSELANVEQRRRRTMPVAAMREVQDYIIQDRRKLSASLNQYNWLRRQINDADDYCQVLADKLAEAERRLQREQRSLSINEADLNAKVLEHATAVKLKSEMEADYNEWVDDYMDESGEDEQSIADLEKLVWERNDQALASLPVGAVRAECLRLGDFRSMPELSGYVNEALDSLHTALNTVEMAQQSIASRDALVYDLQDEAASLQQKDEEIEALAGHCEDLELEVKQLNEQVELGKTNVQLYQNQANVLMEAHTSCQQYLANLQSQLCYLDNDQVYLRTDIHQLNEALGKRRPNAS